MKRKPFLITDNTSGVYSFAYDNLNRMTTRVMPNGVSTTTDYDGMGRMKFFKNTNASSNVLNEFVYSYNTANQITQITEPTVRTRTFGYDNADRLTTSTSTLPNQNESYTFDDVGNRTSSHLSSVYGYQSGSFNRLSSTQQASYSFDNNGNLTSKTEGTAKWYYSYDRENRLTNATKFGGLMPRANESVIYQYDALGRRVVRQDKKTGRTEFTHDGMDVIQDRFEKNDGTLSTTNYINGIGIDNKLKLTSGTTSRYFLQDHLGSTVGMADSSGAVTESASYDSFGRVISSNLTTRYQYTGRETDEKTGLIYYRARQYDPQIGRFTSEDPIGFAGGDINLYGYVWNDPQNWVDPSGLNSEIWDVLLSGTAGGSIGFGGSLLYTLSKESIIRGDGEAMLGYRVPNPSRPGRFNWVRTFHFNKAHGGYPFPHINAYGGPLKKLNHLRIPQWLYRLGSESALKNIGRATIVLGIALDVYNIYNAGECHRWQAIIGAAGGWIGAFVGGAIGSVIASPGAGTVIGGFAGSVVGGIAGDLIGGYIDDSVAGDRCRCKPSQ